MPLSTPNLKFLFDENVKRVLYRFLFFNNFDIVISPKSAKDSVLASISKEETRILITNDEDFKWYSKDKIYSVILLKIPQHDSKTLLLSFERLLKEFNGFKDKLIILEPNKWEDFPLWEEVDLSS